MNAQSMYYDYFLDTRSPLCDDYVRVVNRDEDMNEYISYEKFDSKKYQDSLGVSEDWSLKNLLKAGIDPDFPIHTTFNTRIEGIGTVDSFVEEADSILNEVENESNVE